MATGKRRRRRKQMPDNLKEKRGYCKLKEEALDRIVCRTRFVGGYGAVVRADCRMKYALSVRPTFFEVIEQGERTVCALRSAHFDNTESPPSRCF